MDDIIDVILHTLLSIICMFLLTKLLGKRQLSEISLFGYVSGISIGNIAAYIALESDQRYLALICLGVWGATTYALEKITLKNEKLRHVIDGTPRLLIENGVVYKQAFKSENLTVDEFLEQMHDHDVYKIEDIQNATIEPSGDVTVLLKTDALPITPATLGIKVEAEREPATIIIDSIWQKEKIEEKHLSIDHFEKIMKQHHIAIEDVFIAQAYDKKNIYFCFKDGRSKKVSSQEEEITLTINEIKDMLVKLNHFLNKQT